MLPLHLIKNPFPDTKWNRDHGPIVVVDGKARQIRTLKEKLVGQLAYVVGANQRDFDHLCRLIDVPAIQFYEMRVQDCSALSNLQLEELGITWNTKLESLDFLTHQPLLRSLVIRDIKRIKSLEPLSSLTNLEFLEYSGGDSNNQKIDSFRPLSQLLKLRYLGIEQVRVLDDGLYPLAALRKLEKLSISNQFETEDFAYLSVKLPNTVCEKFEPYCFRGPYSDGKDVMITGRRKPHLSLEKDAEKVERYVDRFRAFQAKYSKDGT